jgi:uncharacterized repeat protein (TIGR04138 family)
MENDLRYSLQAYLFILNALDRVVDNLLESRHVSGRELSEGCRELAVEEYGPFARTVLEYWGITSTKDFGELIFNLLDCGILTKTEEDSKEDFLDLYDFGEAFKDTFPWE